MKDPNLNLYNDLCPICNTILTKEGQFCKDHGYVRPLMNAHVVEYLWSCCGDELEKLYSTPNPTLGAFLGEPKC